MSLRTREQESGRISVSLFLSAFLEKKMLFEIKEIYSIYPIIDNPFNDDIHSLIIDNDGFSITGGFLLCSLDNLSSTSLNM